MTLRRSEDRTSDTWILPGGEVEELLEDGLTLYGRGDEEGAIARWRRVLEISPGDSRALDYLESAGVPREASDSLPTPALAQVIDLQSRRPTAHTSWRAEAADLIRDGRYEDALALLYGIRAQQPEDREIPASIRSVKEHLAAGYAQRLGGLDRIPDRELSRGAATPEEQTVLRFVDGTSSFDDVASASPLGRIRTLGILVRLFGDRASAPAWAPTSSFLPPPSADPPEPTSELRGIAPAPPSLTFDALFESAMRAYLTRRLDEAEALFERCNAVAPGDPRVRVCLERLATRRKSE